MCAWWCMQTPVNQPIRNVHLERADATTNQNQVEKRRGGEEREQKGGGEEEKGRGWRRRGEGGAGEGEREEQKGRGRRRRGGGVSPAGESIPSAGIMKNQKNKDGGEDDQDSSISGARSVARGRG